MGVIGVHYNDGGKPELGYEAVFVYFGLQEKLFNTGDFVRDWYDAMKFIIKDESVVNEFPWGHSSSVDHFFMDGAPYDRLRLVPHPDDTFTLEDVSEGLSFFVHEGTTPTWEELREYCGDKKTNKIEK